MSNVEANYLDTLLNELSGYKKQSSSDYNNPQALEHPEAISDEFFRKKIYSLEDRQALASRQKYNDTTNTQSLGNKAVDGINNFLHLDSSLSSKDNIKLENGAKVNTKTANKVPNSLPLKDIVDTLINTPNDPSSKQVVYGYREFIGYADNGEPKYAFKLGYTSTSTLDRFVRTGGSENRELLFAKRTPEAERIEAMFHGNKESLNNRIAYVDTKGYQDLKNNVNLDGGYTELYKTDLFDKYFYPEDRHIQKTLRDTAIRDLSYGVVRHSLINASRARGEGSNALIRASINVGKGLYDVPSAVLSIFGANMEFPDKIVSDYVDTFSSFREKEIADIQIEKAQTHFKYGEYLSSAYSLLDNGTYLFTQMLPQFIGNIGIIGKSVKVVKDVSKYSSLSNIPLVSLSGITLANSKHTDTLISSFLWGSLMAKDKLSELKQSGRDVSLSEKASIYATSMLLGFFESKAIGFSLGKNNSLSLVDKTTGSSFTIPSTYVSGVKDFVARSPKVRFALRSGSFASTSGLSLIEKSLVEGLQEAGEDVVLNIVSEYDRKKSIVDNIIDSSKKDTFKTFTDAIYGGALGGLVGVPHSLSKARNSYLNSHLKSSANEAYDLAKKSFEEDLKDLNNLDGQISLSDVIKNTAISKLVSNDGIEQSANTVKELNNISKHINSSDFNFHNFSSIVNESNLTDEAKKLLIDTVVRNSGGDIGSVLSHTTIDSLKSLYRSYSKTKDNETLKELNHIFDAYSDVVGSYISSYNKAEDSGEKLNKNDLVLKEKMLQASLDLSGKNLKQKLRAVHFLSAQYNNTIHNSVFEYLYSKNIPIPTFYNNFSNHKFTQKILSKINNDINIVLSHYKSKITSYENIKEEANLAQNKVSSDKNLQKSLSEDSKNKNQDNSSTSNNNAVGSYDYTIDDLPSEESEAYKSIKTLLLHSDGKHFSPDLVSEIGSVIETEDFKKDNTDIENLYYSSLASKLDSSPIKSPEDTSSVNNDNNKADNGNGVVSDNKTPENKNVPDNKPTENNTVEKQSESVKPKSSFFDVLGSAKTFLNKAVSYLNKNTGALNFGKEVPKDGSSKELYPLSYVNDFISHLFKTSYSKNIDKKTFEKMFNTISKNNIIAYSSYNDLANPSLSTSQKYNLDEYNSKHLKPLVDSIKSSLKSFSYPNNGDDENKHKFNALINNEAFIYTLASLSLHKVGNSLMQEVPYNIKEIYKLYKGNKGVIGIQEYELEKLLKYDNYEYSYSALLDVIGKDALDVFGVNLSGGVDNLSKMFSSIALGAMGDVGYIKINDDGKYYQKNSDSIVKENDKNSSSPIDLLIKAKTVSIGTNNKLRSFDETHYEENLKSISKLRPTDETKPLLEEFRFYHTSSKVKSLIYSISNNIVKTVSNEPYKIKDEKYVDRLDGLQNSILNSINAMPLYIDDVSMHHLKHIKKAFDSLVGQTDKPVKTYDLLKFFNEYGLLTDKQFSEISIDDIYSSSIEINQSDRAKQEFHSLVSFFSDISFDVISDKEFYLARTVHKGGRQLIKSNVMNYIQNKFFRSIISFTKGDSIKTKTLREQLEFTLDEHYSNGATSFINTVNQFIDSNDKNMFILDNRYSNEHSDFFKLYDLVNGLSLSNNDSNVSKDYHLIFNHLFEKDIIKHGYPFEALKLIDVVNKIKDEPSLLESTKFDIFHTEVDATAQGSTILSLISNHNDNNNKNYFKKGEKDVSLEYRDFYYQSVDSIISNVLSSITDSSDKTKEDKFLNTIKKHTVGAFSFIKNSLYHSKSDISLSDIRNAFKTVFTAVTYNQGQNSTIQAMSDSNVKDLINQTRFINGKSNPCLKVAIKHFKDIEYGYKLTSDSTLGSKYIVVINKFANFLSKIPTPTNIDDASTYKKLSDLITDYKENIESSYDIDKTITFCSNALTEYDKIEASIQYKRYDSDSDNTNNIKLLNKYGSQILSHLNESYVFPSLVKMYYDEFGDISNNISKITSSLNSSNTSGSIPSASDYFSSHFNKKDIIEYSADGNTYSSSKLNKGLSNTSIVQNIVVDDSNNEIDSSFVPLNKATTFFVTSVHSIDNYLANLSMARTRVNIVENIDSHIKNGIIPKDVGLKIKSLYNPNKKYQYSQELIDYMDKTLMAVKHIYDGFHFINSGVQDIFSNYYAENQTYIASQYNVNVALLDKISSNIINLSKNNNPTQDELSQLDNLKSVYNKNKPLVEQMVNSATKELGVIPLNELQDSDLIPVRFGNFSFNIPSDSVFKNIRVYPNAIDNTLFNQNDIKIENDFNAINQRFDIIKSFVDDFNGSKTEDSTTESNTVSSDKPKDTPIQDNIPKNNSNSSKSDTPEDKSNNDNQNTSQNSLPVDVRTNFPDGKYSNNPIDKDNYNPADIPKTTPTDSLFNTAELLNSSFNSYINSQKYTPLKYITLSDGYLKDNFPSYRKVKNMMLSVYYSKSFQEFMQNMRLRSSEWLKNVDKITSYKYEFYSFIDKEASSIKTSMNKFEKKQDKSSNLSYFYSLGMMPLHLISRHFSLSQLSNIDTDLLRNNILNARSAIGEDADSFMSGILYELHKDKYDIEEFNSAMKSYGLTKAKSRKSLSDIHNLCKDDNKPNYSTLATNIALLENISFSKKYNHKSTKDVAKELLDSGKDGIDYYENAVNSKQSAFVNLINTLSSRELSDVPFSVSNFSYSKPADFKFVKFNKFKNNAYKTKLSNDGWKFIQNIGSKYVLLHRENPNTYTSGALESTVYSNNNIIYPHSSEDEKMFIFNNPHFINDINYISVPYDKYSDVNVATKLSSVSSHSFSSSFKASVNKKIQNTVLETQLKSFSDRNSLKRFLDEDNHSLFVVVDYGVITSDIDKLNQIYMMPSKNVLGSDYQDKQVYIRKDAGYLFLGYKDLRLPIENKQINNIIGVFKDFLIFNKINNLVVDASKQFLDFTSSFGIAMAHGVNPLSYPKLFTDGVKHSKEYHKTQNEILKIKIESLSSSKPLSSTQSTKLKNLYSKINKNPISPLISQGGVSSVVADIEQAQSSSSGYSNRLTLLSHYLLSNDNDGKYRVYADDYNSAELNKFASSLSKALGYGLSIPKLLALIPAKSLTSGLGLDKVSNYIDDTINIVDELKRVNKDGNVNGEPLKLLLNNVILHPSSAVAHIASLSLENIEIGNRYASYISVVKRKTDGKKLSEYELNNILQDTASSVSSYFIRYQDSMPPYIKAMNIFGFMYVPSFILRAPAVLGKMLFEKPVGLGINYGIEKYIKENSTIASVDVLGRFNNGMLFGTPVGNHWLYNLYEDYSNAIKSF